MSSKVFVILLVFPVLTVFALPTENELNNSTPELGQDGRVTSLATRKSETPNDKDFYKVGEYEGIDESGPYKREYYVSTTISQWLDAPSICYKNGMTFLDFKTKHEADAFMIGPHRTDLFNIYNHIGGIFTKTQYEEGWSWIDTGKKINFDLDWADGEPNNYNNSNSLYLETCLSLQQVPGGFFFNDIRCSEDKRRFLCVLDL